MQFTDVCFVTKDALCLRSFYEIVFGKFSLSEFFCLQSFTTYAIILLSSSMA